MNIDFNGRVPTFEGSMWSKYFYEQSYIPDVRFFLIVQGPTPWLFLIYSLNTVATGTRGDVVAEALKAQTS